MNCYECTKAGDTVPAIATCPDCGAGLCLHHLDVAAATPGPGGTTIGCPHDTWSRTPAAEALRVEVLNHEPQRVPVRA